MASLRSVGTCDASDWTGFDGRWFWFSYKPPSTSSSSIVDSKITFFKAMRKYGKLSGCCLNLVINYNIHFEKFGKDLNQRNIYL